MLRPEVIDGNGIGNIHKPSLCPINHLRKYPDSTDKQPSARSSSSSSSSGVTQLEGNASLKGKNRRFLGGDSYSSREEGSRNSSKSVDLVSNPDVLLPLDMTACHSTTGSTGTGTDTGSGGNTSASTGGTPSLPGGEYVSLRCEQMPMPSFVGLSSGMDVGMGFEEEEEEAAPSPPVFSRQDTFGGESQSQLHGLCCTLHITYVRVLPLLYLSQSS